MKSCWGATPDRHYGVWWESSQRRTRLRDGRDRTMSRHLLAVLGVLATTFVLAVRADDRLPVKIDPKNKGDVKRADDAADPKVKIEDAAIQQERLKSRFDDFKAKLLSLAQRMENSSKPEDQEK